MKIEDLKNIGIEDEDLQKKIFALYGKGIEKHKADAEQAATEAAQIKAQLDEATKMIEGFKELDVESIKKTADEWKTKAEQAAKEAEEKVKNVKFEAALDMALAEAKVRNKKALKALLEREALQFTEDETIEGLAEQLETIKTENEYLFEDETPKPRYTKQSNNQPVYGDSFTQAIRKGAGLAE